MVDITICVITNLFRIYLIGRFVHIFMDDEDDSYDWMRHMLAYGGFFIVNTVAYLVFHTVWINAVCNLAGIGLIVLTCTRSVKLILFVTCSVYMINIGCDTISTLLFVDYKDGLGFSQIYEVITVFLIFICELLTERIVDAGRNMKNIRNVSLALVPLCSIGMFCALTYTESSTETGLVICSIGLVLIIFFTFYLYNMQVNALFHKYENEVLRQEIKGYVSQLDAMLQGEEKVKALRHDMKHHMNELKILAAKGERRAIEGYIDDMQEFITNPYGRKQEELAAALGVTKQAVSRWEANGGYPDMQMLPAIANYFHITIDELFGYDNDRQIKLQSYIDQADRMLKGGDMGQLLEFLRRHMYDSCKLFCHSGSAE